MNSLSGSLVPELYIRKYMVSGILLFRVGEDYCKQVPAWHRRTASIATLAGLSGNLAIAFSVRPLNCLTHQALNVFSAFHNSGKISNLSRI